MAIFKRSPENPVFLPNRENDWEAEAAFNGSVVEDKKKIHMVYRAVSLPRSVGGLTLEVSSIGHAVSGDGVHFRDRTQLVKPEYNWERYGCEDPRVTKLHGKYFIFYTAISAYPFTPEGIKVAVAITKDFKKIDEKHQVAFFNSKAMALFPEEIGGKMVAVLTVNTDKPPAKIGIAFFDKEEDMWSEKYWEKWYASLDTHTLPLRRTPNDHVEIGAPPLKTKQGWLLVYSYIRNYFTPGSRVFGVEAVLLDLKDPSRVLGRTFKPIFVPEEEYEEFGRVPKIVFPSGGLIRRGKLFVYYGATDTTCCLATAKCSELMEKIFIPQLYAARLTRFEGNPIIAPHPGHAWEAKATFNPGVLYEGDKIHLLYRAMSSDDTSVLGYASSKDGVHIDERLAEPVYVPRENFERKNQAGNSGCEDARLTVAGDTVYMCYTAFDGKNPPRVALTSIPLRDFLNKTWRWAKPTLISPPDIDDKDACVLLENIKGKKTYMFFHRIGSNIWIDFHDTLSELGTTKWLGGSVLLRPREDTWDSKKLGIAAPPLKTKAGWLLLYHGVSDTSHKYRVGAALLDIKDPTRVLARTAYPILEPEAEYEREGQVPNVVFPCGAAVVGEKLFVYYGGGDKVVGVADIKLSVLLDELVKEKRNQRNG